MDGSLIFNCLAFEAIASYAHYAVLPLFQKKMLCFHIVENNCMLAVQVKESKSVRHSKLYRLERRPGETP